ncbi:MAG: hypothetical protein Hyperionvirus12_28 [Hyperionvirus sp.]|uniref:Uncharacterized protein n=1 Tax=Hyperionvirus sp. TaxID=2487770 RepID=A0A3G5AC32_9VIRU|nr:MAG: hypothetical protein Hyperionvirus12_28 [Hyperionvirus sp.]
MPDAALLVLVLVGAWCVKSCNVDPYVEDNALIDFCQHGKNCYITTSVPTEVPTMVATTTEHKMVEEKYVLNFVYFANVSYLSDATTNTSGNLIGVTIMINNVKTDPCLQETCWMRVRIQSDYPFDKQNLGGYYDYTGTVLNLYLQYSYEFPAHTTGTNFTVSFETCIINPLFPFNHCTKDNSKYDGVALFVKKRC